MAESDVGWSRYLVGSAETRECTCLTGCGSKPCLWVRASFARQLASQTPAWPRGCLYSGRGNGGTTSGSGRLCPGISRFSRKCGQCQVCEVFVGAEERQTMKPCFARGSMGNEGDDVIAAASAIAQRSYPIK